MNPANAPNHSSGPAAPVRAGASAASGGRLYLYALAAAGEAGVERALGIMQEEIVRAMKLMGVTRLDQLGPDRLRYR